MRVRLALFLLLAGAAAARAQTVENATLHGAYARITVPADWNGSLVRYPHGSTSDTRSLAPLPDDFIPAVAVVWPGLLDFVPAGYATAVTTFRSTGWDVEDALKDIERLRRHFVKRYGKPQHTYIWGHSEGGMITAAALEYFPDTYDGGAPMCGTVGGGRRLFNGEYDLRVLFEYACRDVAAARFACGVCTDGSSRCLEDADCTAGQACTGTETPPPPEDGLTQPCFQFIVARPE